MIKTTVFMHMKNGDKHDFDYMYSNQEEFLNDLMRDAGDKVWIGLAIEIAGDADEISHFVTKTKL